METFIERIEKLLSEHGGREIAGPPAPWGVLYSPPNKDGSKKKCGNCFAWVKGMDRCIILPKNKVVTEKMTCGYHVYGTPRTEWPDFGIQAVDPKLAGLVTTKNGSCCGDCKHYEKEDENKGECYKVSKIDGQKKEAIVERLGCCAAWSSKD